MNLFLGGWGGTPGGWGPAVANYRIHMRYSDLVDPGPAGTFVFVDMREDSIDMGNFCTNMRGWPNNPSAYVYWDLPGFYHNGACGFSFADGHSEIKKWRDTRTMPPMVRGSYVNDVFNSPNNQDVGWLQERSTRPK